LIGKGLGLGQRAALREYILTLADDELVLGHRDSEWCAFAPLIEEDVAFASIAQDEMAHAALLYGLLEEDEAERDALAFGRDGRGMRSAVLLERPNGDWAYSLVRHHVYDIADDLRTGDLLESKEPLLRAAAERMRREERYHLAHGRSWLSVLAAGGACSRERLERAVDAVAADSYDLLRPLAWEGALVAAGALPRAPSRLWDRFVERVGAEVCAPLGLAFHPPTHAPRGREGEHSAAMDDLLRTMSEVYRSDPRAVW